MAHFFKRLLKYCWFFILFIVSFIIAYLAVEYCLSSITVEKELSNDNDVAIYIKTNGVHTDIVMPVKNEWHDWSKSILFANTHLQDSSRTQWLAVGWGDKGFYLQTPTWADLTFATTFKAAFGLSTTAIHATYYSQMTESKFCKKIILNKDQYARLVNYCYKSFTHDLNGGVILVSTAANYNDADAFYEANGRYSLLTTCNTWANSALKACGQKACLWAAFDKRIFEKYEHDEPSLLK